MPWYWIVTIGIFAFMLGFAVALFWLRDVVRRTKKQPPPLPHYTKPGFTQMNPYYTDTTSTM